MLKKLRKQLELFENKDFLSKDSNSELIIIFIAGKQMTIYPEKDRFKTLFIVDNISITVVFDKATVYPDYIILLDKGAMVAQIKTN